MVPLGPALAQHDYDAYMSSIDHLRKTFSGGGWPNQQITMVDALKDVEGEIARFHARESFTYAVLTLTVQKNWDAYTFGRAARLVTMLRF